MSIWKILIELNEGRPAAIYYGFGEATELLCHEDEWPIIRTKVDAALAILRLDREDADAATDLAAKKDSTIQGGQS